jgi:phosphoglycerate dehydrogenase-like enzyme
MNVPVLCLRPEADFQRVDALPPDSLLVWYRGFGDADVPELMKQATALVIPAVGPPLPLALFGGTTVKFVQVTGAGLDRVDLEFLKRLGIAVANVPGGSNSAVAEYVVTAASALLRRFTWATEEIRAGKYCEFRAQMIAENLAGLAGLKAGIIGFGTIGVAVAEAFQQRGCSIVYYDPAPRETQGIARLGAKAVPLDELLRTADVVTLHVPLLPSTKHLIGAGELQRMKSGAVLIQASRGGIVDEAALAECLQTGKIAGAAVDVYAEEPPSANHALLTLQGEAAKRLWLTPHIAGVTRQSTRFLCRKAWENVHRVLVDKQPPLHSAF